MAKTIHSPDSKNMRDLRIDVMRVVGLLMIILAHVNPPGFIFQLRNFDVPLMVLVSGMSFALTYRAESYRQYFFKRFKRLVFPVWIFLTFYFSLNFLFEWPVQMPQGDVIRDTYFLIGGIGYVWIIRVFLLVAIIAPLIHSLSEKQTSNSRFLSKVLLVYLVYESSLYFLSELLSKGIGLFVKETVYYLIPYSLVFALGLRLHKFTRPKLYVLALIFISIFTIFCAWHFNHQGKFIQTQLFKYPPTAYYLSYALLIAVLIWLCSDSLSSVIKRLRISGFVEFISSNSIWIYLWHIPFISFFQIPFLSKYLFVLVTAISITWLQIWFVKKVVGRIQNPSRKKFILTIFTG